MANSTKQVVLVFRWVDNALNAHKVFVGHYQTESLQATMIIKKTPLRFINFCQEQCQGGASVIRSIRTRDVKLILRKSQELHC